MRNRVRSGCLSFLIVNLRVVFICLRHSLNDLTAVHRDSEKIVRRITRALMLGEERGQS